MISYRYVGENLRSAPYLRKEHFYVSGVEVNGSKVAKEIEAWFSECLKRGTVETIIVFQHPRENPNLKDVVHFIHEDMPEELKNKIEQLKQEECDAQEKVYSGGF